MLARSVVLVSPAERLSPYAADLLAAAKRASRVTDTRILQVLDAVDDGELSYIVREWATGQSLDVVLSEGPLAARRATWLMREVAAAVGNAHRLGLPHRRLAPDNVVVTKSSGVKLDRARHVQRHCVASPAPTRIPNSRTPSTSADCSTPA